MIFTERDLEDLRRRGVPPDEAQRQLALLRDPPAPPRLDRACTVGDGIERLPRARQEQLAAHAEASREAGHWTRFVPASGAATRMFQDLLRWLGDAAGPTGADLDSGLAAGEPAARGLRDFLDGLPRFAFHDALAASLAQRGLSLETLLERREYRPVLEALLEPAGLAYASLPKGLLAFHRVHGGARTAFEEQIVEGVPLVRDRANRARFHFTVTPAHEPLFHIALDQARERIGRPLKVQLVAGFSHQGAATDTLAAALDGAPFRDPDGSLVFRPAGHGALIGNLLEAGTPFVFVKNVDNIAQEQLQEAGRWWAAVLAGRVVELAEQVARALARLSDGSDVAAIADAVRLLRDTFGVTAPAGPEPRPWLLDRLARPIRVCGMVPNTGEPGGGPFWVRDPDGGSTPQIVEAAQVDARDPGQKVVFADGTHFNPVFLAARLTDPAGRPHALERFVDPSAVIVTRKSSRGRELLALERPGLWNGAMAGWLTAFVEVPAAVFTPVKTVQDLLRAEHQP